MHEKTKDYIENNIKFWEKYEAKSDHQESYKLGVLDTLKDIQALEKRLEKLTKE